MALGLAELAASAEHLYLSINRFSYQVGATNRERAGGRPNEQMLSLDRRMEMVKDISSAIKTLARDGHRFRRAQARALYAGGLTMAQLAAVFGVSRQRVSTLLREAAEVLPDAATPDSGTARPDGANRG